MSYTLSDFVKLNELYGDKMETCFGPTLLTYPEDADGCRMLMASQNFKQCIAIKNPGLPRILTGHENIFGKLSGGYKKLEGEWSVVEKINKFNDGSVYTLVLYNKKKDEYDMIERHIAENLVEKFGFVYNTEKMDSLKPGDVIKDEVLYKSTSYDKNMNYRMGKPAKAMYTVDNDIIEDAIKVSRSFAESVVTYEIGSAEIKINDNDIMLLIHGDEETGRRTIPHIGEIMEDGIICAISKLNKNHLLYDMKEEHLTTIDDKATSLKVGPYSYVYDMDIYYNGDDPFPDNVFYRDLKEYYDQICEYRQRLFEVSSAIKDSGSNYTINVTKFKHDSQHFNDPEYKWKDKDTVFNNILIKFKTIKEAPIKEGYKITGRYGDKGVISKIADNDEYEQSHGIDKKSVEFGMFADSLAKMVGLDKLNPDNIEIVEDEHMPYTEDGVRIDIVLDLSGAVRRLNFGQVFEVDINFYSERIRQYVCTLPTYDEKIKIIFEYLGMLNQHECQTFIDKYRIKIDGTEKDDVYLLDDNFKKAFCDSVEKDGFYIIKSPDAPIRYDAIKAIHDRFKDICPKYQLYIDRFGIKGKKVILPAVVGEKQIIVLKQTSTKNFSSRSMARVSKSGLPAKSSDKKENRKYYADTPLNISEIGAIAPSVEMLDLARYNLFVRSSPAARRSLKKTFLTSGNPLQMKDLPLHETYDNVAVLNLMARFKVMGIRVNMVTDKTITEEALNEYKTFFTTFGFTFFDKPKMKKFYTCIISRYNEAVRNGAIRSSDLTWKNLMNSEEMQVAKPPKDIVDICKEAIRAHEENLGLIPNEDKLKESVLGQTDKEDNNEQL